MQPLTKRRRWAPLLALALLLAGCGSSASGARNSAQTPASLPSPTPGATASPVRGPTPTPPTGQPGVDCATSRYFAGAQTTRVGDLLVGVAAPNLFMSGGVQLPDAAPSAPQQVAGPYSLDLLRRGALATAFGGGRFPFGYVLVVCDTSPTQAHTLDGVSVRIDHMTPYAGQLNEFACGTRAYSRSQLQGASGCGGAYDEDLRAAFPAGAAVGATIAATPGPVTDNYSDINGYPPARFGPLPATLGPHQGIVLHIEPDLPGASATYAFAFGLGVDGAAPAFGPTSPPVLIAPAAREWTGEACQAPAMQSQIPSATNPPTYYICPAS